MRYSDVKAWGSSKKWPCNPLIDPGPQSDLKLQHRTPNALVFLTLGDGPGLNTENVFDQVFLKVDVFGPQNSYEKAEDLALVIDQDVLNIKAHTQVGRTWVLSTSRTGGRPALVEKDASDRYHFSCTYVIESPVTP